MKTVFLFIFFLVVGPGSGPAEAAVMKCAVNATACPRGNHLQCTMSHGWCGPACGATFCSDGPAAPVTALSVISAEEVGSYEFQASAESQTDPWSDLSDEAVYARARALAAEIARKTCRAKDLNSVPEQASKFVVMKVRDFPLLRIRAQARFRCVSASH